MLYAYFDESGSHDASPILCVAGYLYEEEECLLLDEEWAKILKEYDLPYFHMVSCAHGNYPFDKLSKDDRICAQTKAINAIKNHAAHGFTVTVVEKEYNNCVRPADPFGAAYAFCCFMCLVGIEKWADKNNYDGDIAYFFEAGATHQATANKMLNSIFKNEEMRRLFRYGSHSFVDKKKVRPVQTADILAWQAALYQKRYLAGGTMPREDLKALIRGTDTTGFHADKTIFEGFQKFLNGIPPDIQNPLLGK